MGYDYWHIRRVLRLLGTTEDDVLPLAPSIVVANVVRIPEPVWKAAVATALDHGVPDVFGTWKRDEPLPIAQAARALPALRAAADAVSRTLAVRFPEELSRDDLPVVEDVITVLCATRDLFALAVQQRRAIELWWE